MLNSYFWRMKSGRFCYWSSFLLLALLMVKISSFHVYAHQGEPDSVTEECTVCDVTLENQQPEIGGAMVSLPTIRVIPATNVIHFQSNVSDDSQYRLRSLFSRPPPFLG